MHTHLSARGRNIFLGIVLILCSLGSGSSMAQAQKAATSQPVEHYTVSTVTLPDGTLLKKHTINGPSVPPSGFEVERQTVALSVASGTTIPGVPAYASDLGCSGVSGGISAAYYDRTGYPNIYTGPTNGGVMPLDGNPWPPWSDGFDTWYSNPLIASRNGLDGRTIPGTNDNYWYRNGYLTPEPYILYGRTEHAWTAVGDFMRTSQYAVGNKDGDTQFYTYGTSAGAAPTDSNSVNLASAASATPLTCDVMASESVPDGTLGIKLFYEFRGYAVGACYNQPTDNIVAGGFSLAQFKAEIDAGRPVLLGLQGHNVVGIGYDPSSSLIYIHDGWDYNTHTMAWGGSYSGFPLILVSMVNLDPDDLGSDFDGDGKNDPAKFYPNTGVIWWLKSSTGTWDGRYLGSDTFTYVPGSDFDGDGKTDPAKFYPSIGTVWWLKSSTGTWDGKYLGSDSFTYVSGSDFDGDGKTDPAKFYPSMGTLWWLQSSTGTWDGRYLGSDTFIYVPGSDFDGDGKTDPAKFYPATGTLWWLQSSNGAWDGRWLGSDTFIYVPGSDFDGDGKTDPAKFYPSTGAVWWLRSSTGTWDGRWLGPDSFTYVSGSDFDGDGKNDPAKFYPGTGVIWWLKSSTGAWDGRYLGSDTYQLIK